ncbi:phosphate signaling complex protein PhoU [Oceanibacterium hippocampi]|uniref:Phosphate-specific transport system accessory protein PhoU n=1 Tax=Oceanibacterium hippocampi TaxID=745714 RepID=A0A1Y5SBF8_9PROT|nr:phosphate signaling complex protein PhoU [Oceanibacterium hippocampi]SLN36946.1 Phosphate-specific transport system accessory protein PhoU [Oceanibacterium hippocampi]
MNEKGHIVKSFDTDLTEISNLVMRMGGLAEAQLAMAIDSLVKRDSELAQQTVQGDGKVDELEREIDNMAVRMLALRQPMAADLRVVIAALKISTMLERIADYAANVAKRVIAINKLPPIRPSHAVPRMAQQVQAMIKDVLDAYQNNDSDLAMQVWRRDAEVDESYNSLFRELLTYMMEDPRNIGGCAHLLFMAKNIERVGDLTTNVAEIIHYQVHGHEPEKARPKGDETSFATVTIDDKAEGSE